MFRTRYFSVTENWPLHNFLEEEKKYGTTVYVRTRSYVTESREEAGARAGSDRWMGTEMLHGTWNSRSNTMRKPLPARQTANAGPGGDFLANIFLVMCDALMFYVSRVGYSGENQGFCRNFKGFFEKLF